MPFPEYSASQSAPATAYIRTHELDIDRESKSESSIEAQVTRINRTGASVKIGLQTTENLRDVSAEIDHERWSELQLQNGERVWLSPRHVRVFVRDDADANTNANTNANNGSLSRDAVEEASLAA